MKVPNSNVESDEGRFLFFLSASLLSDFSFQTHKASLRAERARGENAADAAAHAQPAGACHRPLLRLLRTKQPPDTDSSFKSDETRQTEMRKNTINMHPITFGRI